MKWIDGLFSSISEFFKWKTQREDPEVIRLKKIEEIDAQLQKLVSKRNLLMTQFLGKKIKDEDKYSIELGAIVHRIVQLRRERRSLSR